MMTVIPCFTLVLSSKVLKVAEKPPSGHPIEECQECQDFAGGEGLIGDLVGFVPCAIRSSGFYSQGAGRICARKA